MHVLISVDMEGVAGEDMPTVYKVFRAMATLAGTAR
jgi:D-aminopeptidase